MQKPTYILKSHFRGVPEDEKDKRCHFRRYVIDIFLENAVATNGEINLKNVNEILYYFGNLPIENIEYDITAETDQRGGAYNGVAFFTTTDIALKWQSKTAIDATTSPKKIATLLYTT